MWWQNPAFYALAAFVLVVAAAVVDAVAARRLHAVIVTVVVPFVALGLFLRDTTTTETLYASASSEPMIHRCSATSTRLCNRHTGNTAYSIAAFTGSS